MKKGFIAFVKASIGVAKVVLAIPRIGIAYASKRDQKRKWRWTLCK